ncbi:MAG: hypothetical protein B6D64_09710 [Bacteroidetes bacterium 4484_276]|nr:MAG: hypothetical protein B6D64_09710 [Bacteroidetes bacterium 4484_276]
MKKLKLFSIVATLVVLVVFAACKKDDPEPSNSPEGSGLDVSPTFDWEMSDKVSFEISNAKNQVIEITSADGNLVYHKGYSSGDQYFCSVSMAKIIPQLKINNVLVEINSDNIQYTIPMLKSINADTYAICLDGQVDYVDVENGMVTDYPFTMSAWFKAEEDLVGSDDMVVLSVANTSSKSKYYGIFLEFGEEPNIPMGTIALRATRGAYRSLYSNVVYEPGEWYHVAAVFESSTSRKLYINGELAGTDNRTCIFNSDMDAFEFGRWADKTPKSYLHGSIDEVRFWNTVRTQPEILAQMNEPLTGNEPGLIGYWPCDEGSGATTADLTGNGNPGTLMENSNWCVPLPGDDADGDGIPDDQDDYPADPDRAFNNYWPASQSTWAFEDLWPDMGDYDMNDLVMGYQFQTVTNAENKVVESFGDFSLMAVGAGKTNGFAFCLPEAQYSKGEVIVSGYHVGGQGIVTIDADGFESGTDVFTVIVYDLIPYIDNTRPGNPYNQPLETQIYFELDESVRGISYEIDDMGFEGVNPFIYFDKDRTHEIHFANMPPTNKMNMSLFGTGDDASDPQNNIYYKTTGNLIWGFNVPADFEYPKENSHIWSAYLHFSSWANSSGYEYPDWYSNSAAGYRDGPEIYSPQGQ